MRVPVRDLFDTPQFGSGLTTGLIVALVALMVIGLLRWRCPGLQAASPAWVPGAVGVAFVVGTTAAIGGLGPLTREAPVPAGVVAGLVALWGAGAVGARLPNPPVAGALLALPGGVLLVDGASGFPVWTAALLILGPACAGTAMADLDDRVSSTGAGPVLFAVALGGMYATVPDTELVRVALGVALPVTLLAWPFTLARLGRGGSYAAAGLFLWIAVVEGIGRSGSTVGAAACLGMLVAEPLGRMVASRQRGGRYRRLPAPRAAASPVVLVVSQLILVLYFARVAGFQTLAARATVLAAPAVAAAVIGAALGTRSRARSGRGGSETAAETGSSPQSAPCPSRPAQIVPTASEPAATSVHASAAAGRSPAASTPTLVSTACANARSRVERQTLDPRSTSWS